ncbi:MAG: glycosyltransferase family 39 protein [Nanoarchaeota archaeon]
MITKDKKVESEEKINAVLDKTIDFLFKNKKLVIILLIFLIGIIFRYIAALNVEPNADEMVHGPHAVGIIDSGVIGRIWQSILWSYMTDVFHQIFGVSMLTSRSLSLIFGSLAIILIYLIGKEISGERAAIIASFLLAISSFSIIYTIIEMDLPAVFFVLLGTLFFIKRIKKDGKLSLLAAFFIGIASLIKTLSLFFVPAFLLFYFFHKDKKINLEKIFSIVKFSLVILLIFSPIFIHNILWYQEKDMVDAYLSQYFDVGKSREFYSTIQGINDGFRFKELLVGGKEMMITIIGLDPIITLLGLFSILFFFRRKEKFSSFFLIFQIFSFLFIDLTNRLTTHYVIFMPVFALYGGMLLDYAAINYSKLVSPKKIIVAFLAITLIINIYIMLPHIGSQNGTTKLREYTAEKIGKDDIVIADARIYRGRMMWLFIDKHYLESSFLESVISASANFPGPEKTYKLFFVECVVDDCGWGTIKDQQQFNDSIEKQVEFFKNNANEEVTFNGGGSPTYYPPSPYFRVYSTMINLKPQIIQNIDSTHNFFYYPANYAPKEAIPDKYDVNGPINNLLYMTAKIIIWISLFAAFGSIIVLLYLFAKEFKKSGE